MSKWLHKGDLVVVTTGNEKGKTGKILYCSGERVVVEGVNMRKKHVKPTQENPQQRILESEGSMHISNVRPCDDAGTPVKLRVRVSKKGGKELVYDGASDQVVYRALRKSK